MEAKSVKDLYKLSEALYKFRAKGKGKSKGMLHVELPQVVFTEGNTEPKMQTEKISTRLLQLAVTPNTIGGKNEKARKEGIYMRS